MEINKTPIEGLVVFVPRVFSDDRGEFFESFNQKVFENAIGSNVTFGQDNQSLSKKGVLRGLHFQNPPYAQGKLVRVIKGAVLDVAVDIRKDSATYGESFSIELSEKNNKQLWIPPGFAHGFIALDEDTLFAYKCTNFYFPESEGTIKWNDVDLNIDWGMEPSLVSEKDATGEDFRNFASQF